MQPPQETPLRKRRRWLVVAIAVAVLMSVGAWGLWPAAVDPRLIGEWRAPAVPEEFQPEYTLQVRRDGLVDHVRLPAHWLLSVKRIEVAGPQQFRVSGDQFEVSNDGPPGVWQAAVRLSNLIRGRWPHVFSSGRIVSVDAERLVLGFEKPGGWEELVFLRVEEGTLGRESGK